MGETRTQVIVPGNDSHYQFDNNKWRLWAEENCTKPFSIRMTLGKQVHAFFESEQDAALFALRWS